MFYFTVHGALETKNNLMPCGNGTMT